MLLNTANFSVRLDPEVKTKAEAIFAELGLNLSDAFNVFLHMSVKWRGFPFEVNLLEPSARLLSSIEEAETIMAEIENGTRKPFANAREMFAAMDAEDEAENLI